MKAVLIIAMGVAFAACSGKGTQANGAGSAAWQWKLTSSEYEKLPGSVYEK